MPMKIMCRHECPMGDGGCGYTQLSIDTSQHSCPRCMRPYLMWFGTTSYFLCSNCNSIQSNVKKCIFCLS